MPELLLGVAVASMLAGAAFLWYALPWAVALDRSPCQALCIMYAGYPRAALALTEPSWLLEQMLDTVLLAYAREGLEIERPVIRVCRTLVPESEEGAASMKRYGFIVVSRFTMTLRPGQLLFVVAHEVAHLLQHERRSHWLLNAVQGDEEVRADALAWLVVRLVSCHAENRELDRAQLLLDITPALLARAVGRCPVPTSAASP